MINSIWFQYGTDINVLQNEITYLDNVSKDNNIKIFGSLFIPSKQFISRFKFRPWKEVYISEKFLYSLENFLDFTSDLVNFYKRNHITPVIESDFYSSEKLNCVYSFLEKKNSFCQYEKYEGWKLNHGSPNFNISNSKNNLLLTRYIDELLEN